MSDTGNEQQADKERLFQNMDEQERIYAPEQVPGADQNAANTDDTVDREAVVGAEGQYAPPVVPAQSSIGASVNTPVPPAPAPDLLTEREQEQRNPERS